MNCLTLMLLTCLSLFAESAVSETVKLSGQLVYSAGSNDISLIELVSLKHSTLGTFSTDSIDHLAKLSDRIILFEDCAGSRKPNCLLREFNIDAKTVSTLRSGYMPTYIPESKMLLFYDVDEESGQKWLYVADIRLPDTARKIAAAPADMTLPNGLTYPLMAQPLQISTDEVIFEGEDQCLWIFNISNLKLTPTGIKVRAPCVWRKRTQQLISYDWNSQEFYQITLKTGYAEKLPQLKGASGLVYLSNDDVVIYGKSRMHMLISETYDIFAYSFDTKKEIKLRAHSHIGSGVWLPESAIAIAPNVKDKILLP